MWDNPFCRGYKFWDVMWENTDFSCQRKEVKTCGLERPWELLLGEVLKCVAYFCHPQATFQILIAYFNLKPALTSLGKLQLRGERKSLRILNSGDATNPPSWLCSSRKIRILFPWARKPNLLIFLLSCLQICCSIRTTGQLCPNCWGNVFPLWGRVTSAGFVLLWGFGGWLSTSWISFVGHLCKYPPPAEPWCLANDRLDQITTTMMSP